MDLAKRVMLVSCTIKLEGLLGERKDKAATQLVEDTYSVAHKRSKATKFLIDRKDPKVKSVIAAAQSVRASVYKMTNPWGDSNMRLLSVKMYSDFDTEIRVKIADMKSAIEEYIREYPTLVDEAKIALNGMFDATQYPAGSELPRMFSVSLQYWPFPEAGHFVAEIASESADEARSLIVNETMARANAAVNDMVNRIESTVTTYVEKLAAYKKDTDDYGQTTISNIFRHSCIDNLKEIARLTRAMNFVDDPDLDSVANQVERLARVLPDTLRDDKVTRLDMVTEGQQLLAKLDAYRKLDAEVDQALTGMADYSQFT